MKYRMFVVFVSLSMLLGACGQIATPTATVPPTVESSIPSTPEQTQEATVILVVDEFDGQFDAMSNQVLEEGREILDEYITPFIEGSVIYDFELPEGFGAANLAAYEPAGDNPVAFSTLLERYLNDERLTEIVQPIVEANVHGLEGFSAEQAPLEIFSEQTEDESADEPICAVNPEGQGIFVADGTGIFVADGTSVSAPGSNTFTSASQGIFVADGTGIFVADGTGIFVADGTILTASNPTNRPHGERVQEIVETLVGRYGNNLPIEVVSVNVPGFLSSNVALAIEQAIAANGQEKNYVVNMSFALIPCRNLDSLLRYDALLRGISSADVSDQQLANALDALLALTKSLTDSDIYDAPLSQDEMFIGFTDELCEEDICHTAQEVEAGQVVFVGAAGNGALYPDDAGNYTSDFPYYPAASDYVISISASEETDDFDVTRNRAFWSNPGLQLLPGVWKTGVTATVTDSSGTPVPVEIVEVGTSFAAPRYSVLAALHLAGDNNTICNIPMSNFPIPATDIWIPTPTSFDIEVCS